MDKLLGQHQKLVDHLAERLEALCDGDLELPRVVVLRGPSGVGKSRIIRELYERLRSRQREPHFWPPLPGGADPVTSDRKLIGPDADGFVWAANALPEFGWWGFKCESNPDVITLAQLLLQRFLPPLSIAAAQQSGIWDRVAAKHSTIRRELAEATAGELTGQALEFLQIADPGVGTAVSWIWKTAMAAKHHADRLHDWDSDVDLGARQEAERRSTAEEVARLIAQLARPALPQVVAFEDGHRMGDHLLSVVDGLAVPRRDRPVLSIITSWPEAQADTSTPWTQWLTKHEDRVAVVDVPPLDTPDLVRILRDYAPQTGNADAEKLVSTLNSPLLLKLWLTLGATARLIDKGDGALIWDDKRFARGLPATLAAVYRMRWRELPESVRHALVLAGIATDPDDPLPKFLPQIIVDAAGDCFAATQTGFRTAANPACWTTVQQTVHSFREVLLAATARSQEFQDEVVDHSEVPELRARIRDALAKQISSLIDSKSPYVVPDTEHGLVLARWYTALQPSPGTDAAYAAAAWLQARRMAEDYRYSEAIELVDPLRGVLPSADSLEMRTDLAAWVGEVGNASRAMQLHKDLLLDYQRIHGAEDPRTLTIRNDIAYWTAQRGNHTEALVDAEALLADRTRILGWDHPETLTSRNNICSLLWGTGQKQRARDNLEALVPVLEQVLGPDHIHTLRSRHTLSVYREGELSPQDSLKELRKLLADQIRVLGEDNEDTFSTRSSIALTYGDLGNQDRAIEELEDLLLDQTEVLGEDHPNTLSTRAHIASQRGDSGDLPGALDSLEKLLPHRLRVLGPDHAETLTTRHNIAYWRARTGDKEKAIDEFKSLLEDRRRALGENHSETQRTRHNLSILDSQYPGLSRDD